jgi:hypothetical protein
MCSERPRTGRRSVAVIPGRRLTVRTMNRPFLPALVRSPVRSNLLWLIVLLVTQCDISPGVVREAHIESVPEVACVRSVLETTPGVHYLKYQEAVGKTISIHGISDQVTNYFEYEIDGLVNLLIVVHSNGREATFFQSEEWAPNNAIPPGFQGMIDRSRPIMGEIERRLEEKCEVMGLSMAIRERCRVVQCPALPVANP